jgi:hypothetical protein
VDNTRHIQFVSPLAQTSQVLMRLAPRNPDRIAHSMLTLERPPYSSAEPISRHSRSNCDRAFRDLGDDAAARCSVAATGKDGGRDTFIRCRVGDGGLSG